MDAIPTHGGAALVASRVSLGLLLLADLVGCAANPSLAPDGGSQPTSDGSARPTPDGGSQAGPDGSAQPTPDGSAQPTPDGGSGPGSDGGSDGGSGDATSDSASHGGLGLGLDASLAPADGGAFAAYVAQITAAVTSPVTYQSGDYLEQWTAPDGRPITAIVKAPQPKSGAPVTVSLSSCSTPAAAFVASITANTMTVSAVTSGTVLAGQVLTGNGIAGASILAPIKVAADGTGTYLVDQSLQIPSETLSSLPDSSPCFATAIATAKSTNAGTILVPANGTYAFYSLGSAGQGHIEVGGLTDVTFDGQGSSFVFTRNNAGFYLTHNTRLRITNLTIRYNLQTSILAQMQSVSGTYAMVPNAGYPVLSTGLVVGSISGTTLTVTSAPNNNLFVGAVLSGNGALGNTQVVSQASGATHGGAGTYVVSQSQTTASGQFAVATAGFGHATQYDPATGSMIGTRFYFAPGAGGAPALTTANDFTDHLFGASLVGQSFVIFPHYYGGVAIQSKDLPSLGLSEDLSLDHVTINSAPGMGITAENIGRGFAVVHSTIEPLAGQLASSEYDGLDNFMAHGDQIFDSNTIRGTGDDASNTFAPVFAVMATGTTGSTLTASVAGSGANHLAQGDTVAFFDPTNVLLGFATISAQPALTMGGLWQFSYVPAIAGVSCPPAGCVQGTTAPIVRDLAMAGSRIAVVNNDIGPVQGRGVVMEEPDALVYGNTIHGTAGIAIDATANIASFLEGHGASNTLIRANTIANPGPAEGSTAIGGLPVGASYGAIAAYGVVPASTTNGTASANWFQMNLAIVGNQISGPPQGCVMLASTLAAAVVGNVCNAANTTDPGGASISLFDTGDVTLNGNSRAGTSTGPIVVDPSTTFAVTNQLGY